MVEGRGYHKKVSYNIINIRHLLIYNPNIIMYGDYNTPHMDRDIL